MIAARTDLSAARFSYLPAALSAAVILAGGAYAFSSQYYVDYETSLLPWLVGRGWVLYRDAIDQHSPLLPTLLSFANGGDPAVLRYVIVLLHVVTMMLTCWLAWRMSGPVGGLIAVSLAELWSVPFESAHLWYDGVLAPFYLALVLLLLYTRPKWPALLSGLLPGLLLGIAVLIKQHALLALPIVGYVLFVQSRDDRTKRMLGLLAGFALPVLPAATYYAAHGALGDAFQWTVLYSFQSSYTDLAASPPVSGEWPVLLALYVPVLVAAAAWAFDKQDKARWRWLLLLWLGAVATLPAYPRYGRFHLEGAVPLLAVMAGAGAVKLGPILWERRTAIRDLRKQTAAGVVVFLLLFCLASGLTQWLQSVDIERQSSTVEAPYAGSIAPVRAWVDANAPPGAPITVYGLDSLLYRILEREPAKPFVPHLTWIDAVPGLADREWAGIRATSPAVALVSSTGWDQATVAGTASVEARLRYDYKEAARYRIVIYEGARPAEIVCLVRVDNAEP